MRIVICTAMFSLLATSVPAAGGDQPVISLARTTKWEMNYDVDSCHLLARFGSGEREVILNITREQPSDAFDLQLYGKMLKYDEITMPVELTFGTDSKPFKWAGVALTMSGPEKMPVLRIAEVRIDGWGYSKRAELPPLLTPAGETAVTAITFKPPGNKRYRLETGSLGAPLAAMRKCTENLVESWGYDPAVEAGLTRHATPVGSPGAWLHSSDFPQKALMQGHNGLIRFRLDVDDAGRPVGCRVLYRTNPDEFADLSCKLLLQRARLTPALDTAGKPVKSFYINNIRWVSGDW